MWTREETRALVLRADDPPTLPERFLEIRRVIEDEEAGARELAAVVRKDQATSAVLLKMANSAFYHPNGPAVASIPEAIARLGFSMSAHIAMTMSLLYGLFHPLSAASARKLWTHAWCVGLLAEGLARRQGNDAEGWFTTGLLHDIGRVMLATRVDLGYLDALGALFGEELVAAERARYGTDHAEIGRWLLEVWRLPSWCREAVGAHHDADAPHAALLVQADRLAHERLPAELAFEDAPEAVQALLETL